MTEQRKPFEPVKMKRKFKPLPGAEARNRVVSSTVTASSFDALYRLGQEQGNLSVGSMAGFVIDYLTRSGKFEALLLEAMREGGQ